MLIRFYFQKGGVLEGDLKTEYGSPNTIKILEKFGKHNNLARHSRYSGREVFISIPQFFISNQENSTIYLSKGDITYWRDWRADGQEPVISFFYGSELARGPRGEEPVNVIGRLKEDQIPLSENIGERIWLQGAEIVEIEILKN
ncbi:MAG: DUF3830 family protein [Caldiserica bacterium]|jgi:hypothetical protein|nr:DUF3830 family protein [Caldisericota bacterium]MDH7562264.1 DUF3830 family protein [Caldisericota bacterium]